MNVGQSRVRTVPVYEGALKLQRVAVIRTWVIDTGVPSRPTEVDTRYETIERFLVLEAVRDKSYALVVLGPETTLVVAEPSYY